MNYGKTTRKGDSLLVVATLFDIIPATMLIMALQLIEASKPLSALSTAVTTDLLVNIADVADIVCAALEGPSTDAAQECRHLQVATRMRGQLTLSRERLLTLSALEPAGSRRRPCSSQFSRSRRSRLVWGLARPCRRRRCGRGRRRANVPVVVLARSSCWRRLGLQRKIVAIHGHARTTGVPTVGCVGKSIVGCRGRRGRQRVISLSGCDICRWV